MSDISSKASLMKYRGWRNIGVLAFLLALACLAATGRSYHVFRSALLILGLAGSSAFAGYMHRIVVEIKRDQ